MQTDRGGDGEKQVHRIQNCTRSNVRSTPGGAEGAGGGAEGGRGEGGEAEGIGGGEEGGEEARGGERGVEEEGRGGGAEAEGRGGGGGGRRGGRGGGGERGVESGGGGRGKNLNTPQMHDHARCPPPHVVCLFIVLYDSTDLKDWQDRVEEGKSMTKRKKVKEEGTDREAERKTDRQIKCNGHKTP